MKPTPWLSRLFLLAVAGLKFGKLFGTVGTMLLTTAVYALVFGWRYAVGIVAMLFIHEMGHYAAARQRGLRVSLPMFIPFAFAWVKLEDSPHDAETDAYIALAGPMVGTLGALACYFVARDHDVRWLLAVSYTGFFINLVNLIPLPPLDGGRITAVLTPRIWLLGVPILGALLWFQFSWILLLVAVLAFPHVMAALRHDPASEQARAWYAAVSPRVRWEYGFVYVALVGFLALMTNQVHEQLRPSRADAEPAQTESV